MKVAVRLGIFGVLLAALCFADGNGAAQDFKKFKSKTPPTTNNRPLTAENLNDPLVPPDILAKVNLNPTQKPMADKVIQEFNAKNIACYRTLYAPERVRICYTSPRVQLRQCR